MSSRRRIALLGMTAVIAGAGVLVGLLADGTTSAPPGSTSGSHDTDPRLRTDALGRLRAFDLYYRDLIADHSDLVRRLSLAYTAWNGAQRTAYIVIPRWYSPQRNPTLPLVISPPGEASRRATTSTSGAGCRRSARSS